MTCLTGKVGARLQVASMRAQLGIRVSGFDAPKPVQTFEQCGFDSALMTIIKKSGCALQTAHAECIDILNMPKFSA